jgi:signal transduction histidine kinase
MANGKLDSRATISEKSAEFASLGRSFNHMAQQVEAMLLRQQEFVANASHELRSPLASIKLRAEALAQGTVEGERARQYAAEINEETIRLGQLVANLLQLSRAESGSFMPPREAISVSDELSAIVRALRPSITAKKQQLAVNIQDSIPELPIYPDDLRLMVENLLDNAVKYTPEHGKVALAAQWADGLLTVEVSDTGPGIPPDDLPHVSERFFRVDRSHNRSVPGTGLGLALVAATAKQYDGVLTLHSSGCPGEGTQACLALKLRPLSPIDSSALTR